MSKLDQPTEKPSETDDAFGTWVDSLNEGWWDDAADAGGFLDSLQEAFNAGWEAHASRT